MTPETPTGKPWFKKKRFIILMVFVFFGVVGQFTGSDSTSTNESSSSESKSQVRSYPVKYLSHAVINPATISVRFSVTNDGSQPVKPDCTIRMRDASGTYRGFDVFSLLENIEPGQSKQVVGQLTITKEGASFADQFSGECTANTTDTISNAGNAVEIYDVKNCSDGDEEGWYWGACFKAKLSPMSQMDCEVTAYDANGGVVGTHSFRGNTLNDGTVTSYGQNERWYVDSTKAVAQSVKKFDVSCTL